MADAKFMKRVARIALAMVAASGLVAAAAQAPSPAARLGILRRAEAHLLEQMPIAPIYWGSRTTLVATSVRGWKPSPLGFRNYKDVWLEP